MFEDILKDLKNINNQFEDMRNHRDEVLARIRRRHMAADMQIKDAMKSIEETGKQIRRF